VLTADGQSITDDSNNAFSYLVRRFGVTRLTEILSAASKCDGRRSLQRSCRRLADYHHRIEFRNRLVVLIRACLIAD
jgi:hypothetical protein